MCVKSTRSLSRRGGGGEAAPELLHGTEELYARLYVLRARRRRCLPFFRFRVNRVKTAVFHRVT